MIRWIMSFIPNMAPYSLQAEEGNAVLAFPMEMTAQNPAQHMKLQNKCRSFCLFWAPL